MVGVKGRTGTSPGNRKTQFKKGNNANGGKAGGNSTVCMADKLDLIMRRKVNVSEFDHVPIGTISPKKSVTEIMAESMIRKAINGDVSAFKEILDRTEGKVAEKVKHMGDADNPLVTKIVRQVVKSKD